MDMYEHSCRVCDDAAALEYVDVFFPNIRWDAVKRRREKEHVAHHAVGSS